MRLRADVTLLGQRIVGTQEAFQTTSQHLADSVKKQAAQLRFLTVAAVIALLLAGAALLLPVVTR
ncbi:hypothetical protein DEDE109153_17770 [Deinococcus deserti]